MTSPTPIQPTGKAGKHADAKHKAKAVWQQLQPEVWETLTATQRSEITRRVLVYLLRQAFNDLD